MSTLAEALAPRSDQLNSDDLIPGPRVLKITNAKIVNDARQLKVVLNYEGDNGKPWKPCKSMGRAMVMAWGITDESQFVGRSVQVYRDPEVSFGDQKQIGGIRISHMSHLERDASVKLTVSQGKKAIFTFKPLVTEQPPAPKARQTAEEWAASHIEQVGQAQDADAIDALQKGAEKAMDKLITSKPELHADVMNAYDRRIAELTPAPQADDGEAGE